MTSLVTGATGFIGSHLAETLVRLGQPVRALVRPSSDTRHLQRLNIPCYVGDLAAPGDLARLLSGVERVYHCAAVVTDWGPADSFRAVNVEGTAALAEAALQAGVRKFVHLSSTEVYGYPDARVGEDALYRYRGWPYCDTKIDGEKRIWDCCQRGLPVTVLRPATVYGPRSQSVVVEIVNRLRTGQMMLVGGGRKTAGLCYVTDLVDLMLRVGEPAVGLGRVYNVADGTGTTWAEFVQGLAVLVGSPPVRASIPRWLAYPVSALAERWAARRSATRHPPVTRMAVEFLGTHQGFDIDRARRELGFRPRVFLAEGLRRTGVWLREMGLIDC